MKHLITPSESEKDFPTPELLQMIEKTKSPMYLLAKRLFDVVCAVLGLLFLFIPLVIFAGIIVIDSPGASPVFIQKRVGKDGRPFMMYKLRTMVPDAESLRDLLEDKNEINGASFKMKDDPRITRFGRFLRRSGMDEILQLINVLKGEMSLVGPRPPLPREVEKYTEFQLSKLNVKPGITGYWQVHPNKYDLDFDDWIKLDRKYMREQSFKTDAVILFKTVGVVFRLEGY